MLIILFYIEFFFCYLFILFILFIELAKVLLYPGEMINNIKFRHKKSFFLNLSYFRVNSLYYNYVIYKNLIILYKYFQ